MKDRVEIGLTPAAREHLKALESTGWFADGQDAARLCLAYAIRTEVPVGETSGVDTQWSSGNFDATGEIRAVLTALYPDCETPVRLMQHFVNEGLCKVGQIADSGNPSLEDFMALVLG